MYPLYTTYSHVEYITGNLRNKFTGFFAVSVLLTRVFSILKRIPHKNIMWLLVVWYIILFMRLKIPRVKTITNKKWLDVEAIVLSNHILDTQETEEIWWVCASKFLQLTRYFSCAVTALLLVSHNITQAVHLECKKLLCICIAPVLHGTGAYWNLQALYLEWLDVQVEK